MAVTCPAASAIEVASKRSGKGAVWRIMGGEEGRDEQPGMEDSPGEGQDGDLKIDGSGDWLPTEPRTLPPAGDEVCEEDAGTDEESETAVKIRGPRGLVV